MSKKKSTKNKKDHTVSSSKEVLKIGRAMIKDNKSQIWTNYAVECDDSGMLKWFRGCSNAPPEQITDILKRNGFELVMWSDQVLPEFLRY